MTHILNVEEKWFNFIIKGYKSVEGRIAKGKFKNFNIGDCLIFDSNGLESKVFKIVEITFYDSFKKYLIMEGLRRTLPDINTIEEGILIYRKYYSEEMENKFGIVAIEFV